MRCKRYRGGSTRCSSLPVTSGGQHLSEAKGIKKCNFSKLA
jgi:hypothetical protein